jgi:hypothetical protein
LSGIFINCSCGSSRTLGGAFNKGSLNSIKKCGGYRPWLGEVDQKTKACGNELHVAQRGASNVYFPEIRSSIYIPQSDKSVNRKIVEILDRHWERLTRNRVNGELNKDLFEIVAEDFQVDSEELLHAANQRLEKVLDSSIDTSDDDSEEMYRRVEYDAILKELGGENQDFYVTKKNITEYSTEIQRYFKCIGLLHKLRETRALVGFTRWKSEDGKTLSEKRSELSLGGLDWLPAIIIRGEGIFFELDSESLEQWLTGNSAVNRRIDLLLRNLRNVRQERGLSEQTINPKFILLHTLAHLLINQLSFESGYGSSSLRERIYCDHEYHDMKMNGILIYTASGDSEGSLGGLVRQGLPRNLEDIITNAINSARWCSSDPVCMESKGQGPDSCNLAACHSCTLLPETSCEMGNRMLDRALITGTHDEPEIGFFSGYDQMIFL